MPWGDHAVGLVEPEAGRSALAEDSPNVDVTERLYGINDQFRGAGPDRGFLELGGEEPEPLGGPHAD